MNKKRMKQGIGWALLLVAALMFLTLALTGRLGILVAIAFTPDIVVVQGNSASN